MKEMQQMQDREEVVKLQCRPDNQVQLSEQVLPVKEPHVRVK